MTSYKLVIGKTGQSSDRYAPTLKVQFILKFTIKFLVVNFYLIA